MNAPPQPSWGCVGLVVLLALVARLIHMAASSDVPTFRFPLGDAAGYLAWSQRIAAGDWVGHKAFYQAPLYPYLLAVWRVLGFDSPPWIRLLQAVWGSAACGLLYLAAAKIFCPRVGLLAGLMLALYAPAIYFDGIIQKASLDGVLICAMLACLATILARATLWHYALLGAVVSLLCLARENAIAWHLVLIVWIGWSAAKEARKRDGARARREGIEGTRPQDSNPARIQSQLPHDPLTRLPHAIAYLLGAAIILVPVGLRNFYVQGEFLLTTAQAGPNFYIGNNANADGRYQPLVRGHETPEFEQTDATQLAEKAEGRALSPREVSRYWMRRAWHDIAADPLRWLRLCGYKFLLTWNAYEIADTESFTLYRRSSPLLGALGTLWNFGGLAPLAALGIALTWKGRRRLWILYALIVTMTLAVAAFYVFDRYRYSLVPLLMPFAAVGCVELWRKRDRLHSVVPPLCAAIAVALLINWPVLDENRLDAVAEMNVGVALAQAGEIQEAAKFFANAVAFHPSSAEANYNLGGALAFQGKYAEAIPYYQTAIRSRPDLVGIHYNFAVALERTGQTAQARTHYEIALQQNPADTEAQAALTRLSEPRP